MFEPSHQLFTHITMIEETGKVGIKARVIADSTSSVTYQRLTTLELEYPRFIHSEFMTHRMLSKNSASSRAIPIKAMHEHIKASPQEPVEWGANNPGMQSKSLLGETEAASAKGVWNSAREQALSHAVIMSSVGAHKQIVNRLTEPFMQMKVVVSGTEWANFFWLRDHEDADPTIRELAKVAKRAMDASIPVMLLPGEWHLPYVQIDYCDKDKYLVYSVDGVEVDLETAKKVSASCCAQVSYRKNDDSVEKALAIYDRLINSQPIHASPVEHQATPIDYGTTDILDVGTWEEGVTHMSANGELWSGNFRDWIQHRQLIQGHAKW